MKNTRMGERLKLIEEYIAIRLFHAGFLLGLLLSLEDGAIPSSETSVNS
jgi:hypothetical protein